MYTTSGIQGVDLLGHVFPILRIARAKNAFIFYNSINKKKTKNKHLNDTRFLLCE